MWTAVAVAGTEAVAVALAGPEAVAMALAGTEAVTMAVEWSLVVAVDTGSAVGRVGTAERLMLSALL